MNVVWLVFRKEVRETFRDKRVVNGAFVAPVFIILMFVLVFGTVQRSVTQPPKPSVALVGQAKGEVESRLLGGVAGKVTRVANREEGQRLLKEGKVRLVVDFSDDFTASVGRGGAVLTLVFDPASTPSQIALGTFRTAVETVNSATVRGVLEQTGLPASAAEPIRLVTLQGEKPEGLGGSSFAGMLPYLIVLWAFYGGFSQVADLVAGEKERGTMETLLVSPALRWHLALGKTLALALTCLLSAASSLVALVVLGSLRVGVTRDLFPGGLSVSLAGGVSILVVLLSLVAMFAGLLMAVSARAKSMREAQTQLTLVSFVVLMPAIFSQFIGFTGMEQALWVRWTPVLNAAVAMREGLLDRVVWWGVGTTVLTGLVLGGVFLWAAFRQFEKESILART